MNESDRNKLDELIIKAIAGGANRFARIYGNISGTGISNRDLDHRLQALRRAGKLGYGSLNGWVAVTQIDKP